MKSSTNWLSRQISVLLILILAIPAGEARSAMAQEPAQDHQRQTAASARTVSNASATNGPADASIAESALPENPAPASQSPSPSQQAIPPQPGSAQPQDNGHKPVGTAAAPYERTTGIAASRPAGAAIAPAKQRRVRTILISLGVVAGAAIAVGSVAALSHGSPSHP
jgi:hypothetical protein